VGEAQEIHDQGDVPLCSSKTKMGSYRQQIVGWQDWYLTHWQVWGCTVGKYSLAGGYKSLA
jgi:hypothetical protein